MITKNNNTYKGLINSAIISDLEDKIKESRATTLKPTSSVDGIDNPRGSHEQDDTDDTQQVIGISEDSLIEKDFLEVRKNIKALIKKGNTAVDKCVDGISSESYPKMIETLSELIKTVLDSNKELLQIHANKKVIKSAGTSSPAAPSGAVGEVTTNLDSASFSRMMDDAMSADKKK